MGLGKAIKRAFGKKGPKAEAAPALSLPSGPALALAEERGGGGRREASFPRFDAMATDQLDRRGADRFSNARIKLRSAFTPSQPITDRNLFSGRTQLLTQMIRALEDQRLHLVVYGERGIGKTSLLHVLAEAAREARYIVYYSSCGAASGFEETFRAAMEDIPVLFHGNFSPTAAEAELGSSLASLLPSGPLTPRQLADVCRKLTGTRVLIILDEFDRAHAPEFRRDISELMKFLSDRSVRVQLIVAGVATDLADMLEYTPSIRRNILAVRVPPMTDAEVRAIVANGERASDLTFDNRARDMIAAFAHGSPYLARLLCHHAGLNALEGARATVNSTDVSSGLDQALFEIESKLATPILRQANALLQEGLGPQLAAIAGVSLRTGGEFTAGDLSSEIESAAECAATKLLVERLAASKSLVESVVIDGRQAYRFVEEGLRHYLWCVGAQQRAQESAVSAPRSSTA